MVSPLRTVRSVLMRLADGRRDAADRRLPGGVGDLRGEVHRHRVVAVDARRDGQARVERAGSSPAGSADVLLFMPPLETTVVVKNGICVLTLIVAVTLLVVVISGAWTTLPRVRVRVWKSWATMLPVAYCRKVGPVGRRW